MKKDETKNVHENHRNRLRERFKKAPESLSKHELLELALFSAIPRVNVNPVAHNLLDKFGSLKRVMHASVSELMQVKGIGMTAATLISVIGTISDAILDETLPENKIYRPSDMEIYLTKFFKDQIYETFLVILLDSKSRIISKEKISQHELDCVKLDFGELSMLFNTKGVESVIVAHNHPNGICEPSAKDDLATEKLLLYCNFASVTLHDHIIVAGNKLFSYRMSDRLDFILDRLKCL